MFTVGGVVAACLTDGFLAGVVGGLCTSAIASVAGTARDAVGRRVSDGLRAGKLPADRELRTLARDSLRAALRFAEASCAAEVGEKQPFLPALMDAWKRGELLERPLVRVRDTADHTWLKAFRGAIKDDTLFGALADDALTDGASGEAAAVDLASDDIDGAMERAVNAALGAWVASEVESRRGVERAAAFADGLEDGFVVDGDAKRRLSVYGAWCLFFREGLREDRGGKVFKAYVVARLEGLSGADAVGVDAGEVARRVVEALGERVPDVGYFDARFGEVDAKLEAIRRQGEETLELLRGERLAVLPEAGRLRPARADFVGRDRKREAFLEKITSGASIHIYGYHGQGGIGKTELAVMLGQEVAGLFGGGQLLINLRGNEPNPPGAAQALATLLPQVGVNGKTPDDLESLQAIFHAQVAKIVEERGPLLIVLDNAASAAQVEPLVAGAPCVTIVTSRQFFVMQGVAPESLDVFEREDALALAKKLAPRLTDDEAGALVDGCGLLALAVRTLATAIGNARTRRAVDILEAFAADRLAHLPEVTRAIETSLELLGDGLREAWVKLGVFVGSFDREAAHAVLGLAGQTATDVALDTLCNAALVQYDEARDRFSLHDLAQEYAISSVGEEVVGEANFRHGSYRIGWLQRLEARFQSGLEAEVVGLYDEDALNVRACFEWAIRTEDVKGAALLIELSFAAVHIESLRMYPRERVRRLSATIATARTMQHRRVEAIALGNIGVAYAELGETSNAIASFEQQLEIVRASDDRRAEGNALGGLGGAYLAIGSIREAIEYYQLSLEIMREDRDRRGEAMVRISLGIASAALGDLPAAIDFMEQGLEVAREVGDRLNGQTALGNLGVAYAALGDNQKAMAFYRERLMLACQMGDRRGEGETRFARAILHAKHGAWRDAAEDMETAREIFVAIEHPRAARAAELAAAYRERAGG